MPRKRATRVQQQQTAKTKKPRSVMAVAENMSSNERKEQLDVFLRDFDSRVKNVLKDIDKKKRTLVTFIHTRFENHIADLPQSIKDMTLEEFAMCGGTIEAALAHARQPMDDPKKKRVVDIQNLKWTEQPLDDIAEEGSDCSVPASVKPATSRPRRQGKTAFQIARDGNKLLMRTPANTAGKPFCGQTPLFTPKFDPYLPTTPENIRAVKPGEKLLISLAGSPVIAGKSETVGTSVTKDEMAQELSEVVGVQLTPNRIEQLLRIVSTTVSQQ